MFEINEKLKNKVINAIPAGYTPLQVCVFVYGYLCSILEYSTEYYSNQDLFAPRFQNLSNLKKVDGETYKDVVCYTFSAIYETIIKELNLSKVQITHGVELEEDGVFADYHDCVELKIDGATYEADSTSGVLANNDLVDLKFNDRKIKHFKLIRTERASQIIPKQTELEQAIDLVHEDLELTKLCDQYVTEKQDEYKKLSLEKRHKLFIEMLNYTPDYSISALNYIHTLKQSIFDKTEYHFSFGKEEGCLQYFQVSFVREALTGEVKVLIFYNPKGYNYKEHPNFETLEILDYSIKNKTLKPMSRSMLYEKIISKMYYEIDGYGNDLVELDSIVINMAVDPNMFGI